MDPLSKPKWDKYKILHVGKHYVPLKVVKFRKPLGGADTFVLLSGQATVFKGEHTSVMA